MISFIWETCITIMNIYCIVNIFNIFYITLHKNIIHKFTIPTYQSYIYIDKKPKPKFRGILHGYVSTLLFISITIMCYYNIISKELIIFLIGKLCIYYASAFYHLYSFKTIDDMKWAHYIDISIMPLSGYAAICYFSNIYGLGFYNEIYLVTILIILNFIIMAFSNIYTSAIRNTILALYGGYTIYISGKASQFNYLWTTMLVIYILGFITASIIDNYRLTNPLKEPNFLFYHKKGIWNLHEDMHLLIFIGDVIKFILSLQYHNNITN